MLAAAGLVLLGRQGYAAEAVVSAAVAAFFLLLDVGYFDPYGGDSPGPRFFVPALPFLALGLGPAFARRPRLSTVAAIASVVASVALLLTWPAEVNAAHVYRWSVWGDLAGFVAHGSRSALAQSLEPTLFGRAGIGRIGGATIVLLAALTAVAARSGSPSAREGDGAGAAGRRLSPLPRRLPLVVGDRRPHRLTLGWIQGCAARGAPI